MSYTNQLIDQLKIANKVESDYAVAKLLGLRPNRISNYRTGTSHADDKTAVMLANALGLDPFKTIAKINEDRATDQKDKAFWRRLSAAAALVGVAMLGMSAIEGEYSPIGAAFAAIAIPERLAAYTLCEIQDGPNGP